MPQKLFVASRTALVTRSVLIAGALLCAALAIVERAHSRVALVIAGIVWAVLCGMADASIVFATWKVDDYGVHRVMRFTKGVHIAWDDILSIRGGFFDSLAIIGRGRAVLHVPKGLRDGRELWQTLLDRVPRNAITDIALGRLMLGTLATGNPDQTASVPVDAPEPIEGARGDRLARWRDNPFFVLGLSPECSRADVERAGQKLMALLAIGSSAAKHVQTPVGTIERTEEAVRSAMAELRDPDKRLSHEPWARLQAGPTADASESAEPAASTKPWPDAMRALGWRRSCSR